MKILLVEDSPTLRHVMGQHIKNAGHELITAESGEEALQLVEKSPIDLIFMDVEMPGLNGFETTRLIREWLGDQWIPIIFVTGHNKEENFAMGIESGGDDYLIKPISGLIVAAKIRAMERICHMRDQLQSAHAKLKRANQKDELTQLFNYRTFKEKAREQWRLSMRIKKPLSFLIVDIDYFDEYKTENSEQEADKCIQTVFSSISSCINRPGDITARMHEDKMIIMLPNASLELAEKAAQLIIGKVEKLGLLHKSANSDGIVTVSVGTSTTYASAGTHVHQQITLTEKALQNAKDNNRGGYASNTDLPQKHILLIDDNDKNHLYIVNLLKNSNYPTICTSHGEEAICFIEKLEPSLIILNIEAESFHAGKLIKEISESPNTLSTPIIILAKERSSSFDMYRQRDIVKSAFTDPLNEPQFLTSVNACLK